MSEATKSSEAMHSIPQVINKEEINQLPLEKFAGKIHLITELSQVEAALDKLGSEELLGFDTETRPSFSKKQQYQVSLLQLSTKTDAFLFRIDRIPFINQWYSLLENQNIVKVGVAIHDDIKALKKIFPFQEQGFLELSKIAKQLGIKHLGLRSLTAIFLQKRISKNLRVSNWEKEELTEAQQVYAATDAWIAREIYETLLEQKIWPRNSSFSAKT